MTYPLQSADLPSDADLTNYMRFQGAFSDEEIYSVVELAQNRELFDGTAGGKVDHEYRNQQITWLTLDDESSWIFDKIAWMIGNANVALWGFTLDGMREDLQFGRYGEGGFFDWHLDMGSKPNERGYRKVSVIIQLSPKEKCEGGELQLMTSKDPATVPMDRGDVIVFPSYFLHRVTPITKGERFSLVLWAHGRAFQ